MKREERSRSRDRSREKAQAPDQPSSGDDSGLVQALQSHKKALEAAGARSKELEEEASGWADTSGIKHAAELVEVLLQRPRAQINFCPNPLATLHQQVLLIPNLARAHAR